MAANEKGPDGKKLHKQFKPPFILETVRSCYDVDYMRFIHFPAGSYRQQIATPAGIREKRLIEYLAILHWEVKAMRERQAKHWADVSSPTGLDPKYQDDQELLAEIDQAIAERLKLYD